MGIFKNICLCALLCGYLGIHNGHLAFFENGKLTEVLPYPAELYSLTDQEALEKGIPYDTPLEKQRIIEDYLS